MHPFFVLFFSSAKNASFSLRALAVSDCWAKGSLALNMCFYLRGCLAFGGSYSIFEGFPKGMLLLVIIMLT